MENSLISRSALLEALENDRMIFKSTITVPEALLAQGEHWRRCVEAAPAVDAVEVKVLRRQLLKAGTLMYGGDEGFEKRIGGYNPSSFVAGFNYALERMNAWSKSLEAERRTE